LLVGNGCNPPDKREERMFEYISPSSDSEKRIYNLENGNQVLVTVDWHHLLFNVNNSVEFESSSSYGSVLEKIRLKDGERWEEFSIDGMDDADSWKKRYRDLAGELYGIKSSFENKWGEVYDEELVGGENKDGKEN